MDNDQKSSLDKFGQTGSTHDPGAPEAPGATGPDAVLEIDPAKMHRFMQTVRDNQNLGLGIVGGLAAAAVGVRSRSALFFFAREGVTFNNPTTARKWSRVTFRTGVFAGVNSVNNRTTVR